MDLVSDFPGLETLVQLMPGHVYLLDSNGYYRGCNDLQAKAFGLNSVKEVIGKRNKDLPLYIKYPNFAEMLDYNNFKVMKAANPEPMEFEEEVPYINSDLGVFKSYKMPIFNQSRQVIGLLGVSHDITDSKRQIKELQAKCAQQELTLDNIMANLPGHVYWVDVNNNFLGCNDQQAYDFGLNSRYKVIGLSVKSFQTPENAETIVKNNEKVIKHGITITEEENFKTKEGIEITYVSKKVPLKNKKGKIVGLLGISLDITELKEALAKAAIEKARAESEENLRKVITTYADAVAHNLRTPLAVQLMQVRFYEEKLPLLLEICEEAKALGVEKAKLLQENNIAMLKGSASTLVECINKIHAIIDNNLQSLNGAIKVHMGQASYNDLKECNIAENFMSDKFNYTGKDGKQLIHMDLGHKFKFKGNSISMDQVITNLIDNALYQINKNGKGKVFIKTEDGGNFNILKVKDTAGGASNQVVESMFDSHFTTKHDGNGVGLDFCKKTMKLFGGDIMAHSVEGEYMEFILSFPKLEASN